MKRFVGLGVACAVCALLVLLWGCGGGGGDASDSGVGPGSGTNDPVPGDPIPPWPDLTDIAADWYAAPDGAAGAAGSADAPLDLATLLDADGPVQPGQRVALQAGTYRGRFTCRVSGTKGAPIVFSAVPGARVTLDGHRPGASASDDAVLTLDQNCEWVAFHGLEITHGLDDRDAMVDGVAFFAANAMLINSVIHDTSQGVGFWRPAEDSALYGNIIYNNGYEGSSRGHGHAIYTQNRYGIKRIVGNILFFGYGYGIHAYTEGGYLRGFDILDNVWFRTGASRPGSSTGGTSDGCLVGGLQPVARTRLEGNHSWAPTTSGRSLRLGWGESVDNEDIILTDNYIVGQVNVQGNWATDTCIVDYNRFHSSPNQIDPTLFPDNIYTTQLPVGSKVVVQTNDYDDARADLIVYNWNDLPHVPVDLSALLIPGAAYRIYSVFDLWGGPVTGGVYDGNDIAIPMGTKAAPQPRGDSQGITGDDDPGRTFGVFILRADRPFGD
ncbi:MAG: right-handed parallel beta-helix repeat-containing protein [Desulfatitalea sp.]|nr:right-handed parallel beta-helix repeat-containing protein [Desulfatitalea sp.]